MRCSVNNCGNNNRNGNKKKIRYFHFPKDKQQLQKWIDFCERDIINTATACICHEHFTPNDFERNIRYELGFTKRNPTKLKPGSNPTINSPREKILQILKANKARVRNQKQDQIIETDDSHTRSTVNSPENTSSSAENSIKVELFDYTEEFNDDSNDIIEYTISETEDYTNIQLANETSRVGSVELEIIDPLNPETNAEEHGENFDPESDAYVRHLEIEVSSLKRQVFFLKDERKKLIDEIENLRATVPSARLEPENTVEPLRNVSANGKVTKTRNSPKIKKTVMLYTASTDTIKKLRKINKTTD